VPCTTCNVSLQQVKDYLGPINIVFMYNKPYFDQSKFGKETIVKWSTISEHAVDLSVPHHMQY